MQEAASMEMRRQRARRTAWLLAILSLGFYAVYFFGHLV